MANVLDQSEVDALLAAVETGAVQEEKGETQIFSRRPADGPAMEVKP